MHRLYANATAFIKGTSGSGIPWEGVEGVALEPILLLIPRDD